MKPFQRLHTAESLHGRYVFPSQFVRFFKVVHRDYLIAPSRDRLEFLRAHDRTKPRATRGGAPPGDNTGNQRLPLAGRADAGAFHTFADFFDQRVLSLVAVLAPEVPSVP